MNKLAMKTLVKIIAMALLLNMAALANAALVSKDLLIGTGDTLLTYDTESGLDWLHLSLTAGMSYNSVLASSYYANGFRYASTEEVGTLWTHAGISGTDSTAFYASHQAYLAVTGLVDKLGGWSFYDTNYATYVFAGLHYPLIPPSGVSVSTLETSGDQVITSLTWAVHDVTWGFPSTGSYLVRADTSVVPIPASLLLVGSGVAGLASLFRYSHKRNPRRGEQTG